MAKEKFLRFERGLYNSPCSVHKRCVENHNSTVACGADHGVCQDPLCGLSPKYDREASEAAREQRRIEREGGK